MLSNTLANIPATALTGTLFIATDTFALYRYDGSTWALIGGPGTGTITGSGTANQVAYFTASGIIASSNNLQFNGTTLTAANDILVNGVTIGNGNGSAASNYVLGTESLRSFTTGNSLIAIGSNCFDTTVQGVEGIAIGYNVMREATVFSNNIGIGFNVMRFANNNGNNIGIGRDVLMGGSMTGFLNVAVGMYSMWRNTSGFQNTAYGHDSLQENTTGAYNVAIGDYAVSSNTTGESNVGLGRRAIQTVTTGSGNIGIGQFAGGQLTTEGPVTGSNNIFIGTNAKTIANNHDNEIVIGYNAIGAGSNTITLGNTSIVNTYLRGTVNANHIAVTKSNSGIAIAITDSANGNALNINKTGSGFAIQVTAGTVSFADNTAMSVNSGSGATVGNGNIDPFGRANDKTFSVNSVGNSAIAINAATGAGRGALIDFGTNGVRTAELISNVNETTLGTLINKPLKFAVNGIEQSRFADTTGNLLIATTTDNLTDKLQVNGSITSNQHITALNYISSTEIVSSSLLTLRFNAAKLIGRNGADTLYYELIKVNSSDQIEIDSSAVGTVFGSYIKTSNPAAGTAQAWKLGSYVSGAIAATGYVQIDIAGNAYKLLTST